MPYASREGGKVWCSLILIGITYNEQIEVNRKT